MSLPQLSLRPIAALRDPLAIAGNAPDAYELESYSYAYAISGGKPPYTVIVLTGELPPDLALNGTAIPAGGVATITGNTAENPD